MCVCRLHSLFPLFFSFSLGRSFHSFNDDRTAHSIHTLFSLPRTGFSPFSPFSHTSVREERDSTFQTPLIDSTRPCDSSSSPDLQSFTPTRPITGSIVLLFFVLHRPAFLFLPPSFAQDASATRPYHPTPPVFCPASEIEHHSIRRQNSLSFILKIILSRLTLLREKQD